MTCRKAEWQCNIERILQRGRKRGDGGAAVPRARPRDPVERRLDRELPREIGDIPANQHFDAVDLAVLAEIDGHCVARPLFPSGIPACEDVAVGQCRRRARRCRRPRCAGSATTLHPHSRAGRFARRVGPGTSCMRASWYTSSACGWVATNRRHRPSGSRSWSITTSNGSSAREPRQYLRIALLEEILERPVMRSEIPAVSIHDRPSMLDRTVEHHRVVRWARAVDRGEPRRRYGSGAARAERPWEWASARHRSAGPRTRRPGVRCRTRPFRPEVAQRQSARRRRGIARQASRSAPAPARHRHPAASSATHTALYK